MVLQTYLIGYSSTCSALCVIATIFIFYHLLMDRTSFSHLHKPVKYYSMFSALSFTICSVASVAVNVLSTENLKISPEEPLRDITIGMILINLAGWGFGVYFLYLLFLSRLRRAYKYSTFDISSYIYCILYVSLAILLLLTCTDVIYLSFLYYSDLFTFIDISYDIYSDWSLLLIIIAEIIHLIISSVLVYMFISRLLQLFMMMGCENIQDFTYDDSSSSVYGSIDKDKQCNKKALTFNKHQESILNVVSKQSILSIVAIVSSQICFLSSILLVIAFGERSNHQLYLISVTFNDNVKLLDCVINCVCILMTFPFQKKFYLSICSNFDACLRTVCVKYVKYKMKKNYLNQFYETLLLDETVELSTNKK